MKLNRPKVLDLFCGGGGMAKGYHDAGFDVVGVDDKPQPNYPFTFVQADWHEYVMSHSLDQYAFIHASPPCQRYSTGTNATGDKNAHPDLIDPVRQVLKETGLPYVIENVPTAPLRPDIKLYGYMFGLPVLRQRVFEIEGFFIMQPSMQKPRGTAHQGDFVTVAGKGHTYNTKKGQNGDYAKANRQIKCWQGSVLKTWQFAMQVPWMTRREEIANAIPPPYAHYIGTHIMEQLSKRR